MSTKYKINNSINYPQLRLIAEDGKQIGVFSRDEALNQASQQGLDLVLVGEGAIPPVAKIIDFNKFLYQQEKKQREAKKSQKGSGVKEVRVGGPFAAEADVAARLKKIREFLADGLNCRVVIKFGGRQMGHPEFGYKLAKKIQAELSEVARVEKEPHFEGRLLVMVLAPVKTK